LHQDSAKRPTNHNQGGARLENLVQFAAIQNQSKSDSAQCNQQSTKCAFVHVLPHSFVSNEPQFELRQEIQPAVTFCIGKNL
jgi:hypothetical protein